MNSLDIELNTERENELENKIINLINSYYSEENEAENYTFLILFDEYTNKLNFFSNINKIVFGPSFNDYVDLSKYLCLKKIIFGSKFNSNFILPNSVDEIIFGYEFNCILESLPINLKIIHFGNDFDHPVDVLPESVEIIKFGKNFNHKLNNLPKNLIELNFNYESKFNHPLNNLPNLKKIYFGIEFNQPLNYLPNSLEILDFTHKSKFNESLDNLPFGIKKLSLPYNYFNSIDNIPDTIEELIILSRDTSINKFPSSLKFLSIDIYLVEILNIINFNYLELLTVIDDNDVYIEQYKKIKNPDKIKSIMYHVHYSYDNLNLTWIIDDINKNDYIPIHIKDDCSHIIYEIKKVK